MAGADTAATYESGTVRVDDLERASSSSPRSRVLALIVGIEDYPGSDHDLELSVEDAQAVDRSLARSGVPSDQRAVLTDDEATRHNILRAVGWLARSARPGDVVVVFYAGHVDRLGGSTHAIRTADGGHLTDDALDAAMNDVAAKHSWVVVAGCFGAGFDEVVRPGRVLTAASAADDLSYESLEIGYSYLVEYLFNREISRGSGLGSVQEIVAAASEAIAQDFPDRVPVTVGSGQFSLG